MYTHVKKALTGTAVLAALTVSSISAHAITNKVISIDPDMLVIETGTITDGFTKISGYHWVNPYYRSDGTFVRGHMRGNPDGYCWNNLGGC